MKKSVCILLAILMLAMAVSTVSAASFPDTEGQPCEMAADVLSGLGIVQGNEKGEYAPDKVLTRAEMTAIILRAINTPEGVGKAIFNDVPSSHWAYATVSAAYQKGIINGMDATTFAPDASVTFEQAVKMVVCAMGYDVQAQTMGGYPTGHLAIASQLDLLKGVSNASPMKRGAMAILLYNALDVELFERTAYGDDAFTYAPGSTLLTAYHKVTLHKGVVQAAPMLYIGTPSEKLLADEALLADGTIVKRGNTSVQALVGMKADVYTRFDDESGKDLAVAAVPSADTEEIVVLSSNIEGATTSVFKYTDENGALKQKNIAGATLIYNGKPAAMNVTKLVPELGNVRLIAAGSQVSYIFVEDFENAIVTSVNTKSNTIAYKAIREVSPGNYAEVADSIVVDPDDTTKANVIVNAKSGKEMKLSSVSKQMILSIAKSEDDSIRKIYASNVTKSGPVEEVNASKGLVTVAKAVYTVDKNLLRLPTSPISVGMTATFRLDAMGNIAMVDKATVSTDTMYGWLADAWVTRGPSGTATFKVFTEDGEWVEYTAADRFELNGADKTRAELSAIIKGTDLNVGVGREPLYKVTPYTWMEGPGIVPQLIKFKVKGSDEISALETAQNLTAQGVAEADKLQDEFSMDYYTVKRWATSVASQWPILAQFNYIYRARLDKDQDVRYQNLHHNPEVAVTCSGLLVFGKYRLSDSSTVLFNLPEDLTLEQNYSVEEVSKVMTATKFVETLDNVAFYDSNDQNQISAVVLHNYFRSTPSSGSVQMGRDKRATYIDTVASSSLAGIITAIGEELDEEGNVAKSIEVTDWSGNPHKIKYEDGQYVGYYGANSDYDLDPDWVWLDANKARTAPRSSYGAVTDATEMLIPIDALDVGDILVWEANSLGYITAGSVSWRSNYPGKTGVRERKGGLDMPSVMSDLSYGIGTIDCVVTDIAEDGGIMAQFTTTTQTDFTPGPVAERNYDLSQIKWCYKLDVDKGEVTAIAPSDILPGDNLMVIIQKDTIRMAFIYE